MLTSGQAEFEVAHEPDRAFRVIAGSAEVVDIGTKFDVRLERDSTVVTVVEGRVAVGPSRGSINSAGTQSHSQSRYIQLGADQQMRVSRGRVAGHARSSRRAERHGLAAPEKLCLTTNHWSVLRQNTIATRRSRSRSRHPRCGICRSAASSPPMIPKHSLPSCAASRACESR